MKLNKKTKDELIQELIKSDERISKLEALQLSHKKAARILRKREEELKAAIESTSDGIFMINTEGKIIHFNNRFAKMWNIPLKLLRAGNDDKLDSLCREQLKEPEDFYLKSETHNKSPKTVVDTLSLKDSRIFKRHVRPLLIDGKIVGCAWSFRDVSRQIKEETELKHVSAELDNTNKMIEQIINTASHDIRAPLFNIEGYSKEIAASAKELASVCQKTNLPKKFKDTASRLIDEVLPDSTKYINASIHKINSLVAGLIKFSHTGSVELNKEHLDMKNTLSYIVDIFEFQARMQGAKIKISELPPCIGDRSQIDQVFSNLIDNALKYLDPSRPGLILISGHNNHMQTTYCVTDNGIGIAPEDHEKIFNMFHQITPSESNGEGLGLSIVQKIIERHEGKIWIKSEPDKGSSFFLSLPS
ncbi:MAG: PAS domain-containing sensor histidine kinase [Nitrospirota bacterium]